MLPVDRYNPWTGFYHTYYHEVYAPGYTETERLVRYQIDVWSTEGQGGRLVWSGTTSTIDPSSGREVNREISKLIVPELKASRMIAFARE